MDITQPLAGVKIKFVGRGLENAIGVVFMEKAFENVRTRCSKKKLGIALSMRGKIASIALMLAVMCSFLSCGGKVISAPEDFVYELTKDGKGVKVTDLKTRRGVKKIIVPAAIENVPVTEINISGYSAPKIKAESVELPDTITSCSITSCELLKSVNLPPSCKKISFNGCSSLADIKLPDGITEFELSETALKEIHIPDGVTVIPSSAFTHCTALETVNIPDGVTQISGYAFSRCTALETVNIPASVKKISKQAFYGCSALKNLNIDENIKSIDFETYYHEKKGRNYYVFEGCTSLPLQTQQKLKSVGYQGKFE